MPFSAEREPSEPKGEVEQLVRDFIQYELSVYSSSHNLSFNDIERFAPDKIKEFSIPTSSAATTSLTFEQRIHTYLFSARYYNIEFLRRSLTSLGYHFNDGDRLLDHLLADSRVESFSEPMPEQFLTESESDAIQRMPLGGDYSLFENYRRLPVIVEFMQELVVNSKVESRNQKLSAGYTEEYDSDSRFWEKMAVQLPRLVFLNGEGYRFAAPVPRSDYQPVYSELIHQEIQDLFIVADTQKHQELLLKVARNSVLLSFFIKYLAYLDQDNRIYTVKLLFDEAAKRKGELLARQYEMLSSRLSTAFLKLLQQNPTNVLLVFRGFPDITQEISGDVDHYRYRKLPYAKYYDISASDEGLQISVEEWNQVNANNIGIEKEHGIVPNQHFYVTTAVKNKPHLGWGSTKSKQAKEYGKQHIVKYASSDNPQDIKREKLSELTLSLPNVSHFSALLYDLLRPIYSIIDLEKLKQLGPAYESSVIEIIKVLEAARTPTEFITLLRKYKYDLLGRQMFEEPELMAATDGLRLSVNTSRFVPSDEEVAKN